jgi:riboflavin synthase
MFTGIIESKAQIRSFVRKGETIQVGVSTDFRGIAEGESIAVNGVCLTATRTSSEGECTFFLSPETLDKSNLGKYQKGNFVNLERALTLQTRLSGHWVQGHVDGQCEWLGAQADPSHPDCHTIQVRVSSQLSRYCVEKGSICLNGVSLTINSISDQADKTSIIGITLIPHTWTHTNLSHLKPGDPVNVEVDILAKYVERLCNT